LVAEVALGRYLPAAARVHHVDGNKANDEPCNLVVCQDQSYHMLIEMRGRAYHTTGDADKKRCRYCGEWDYAEVMTRLTPRDGHIERFYHKPCRAEHELERIRRVERRDVIGNSTRT
jgi:hypothetical protein